MIKKMTRPMLAAMFIAGGYSTVTQPERVAAKAKPVVDAVADRVPWVPEDTETAVRSNGAVQLIAGVLLSVGIQPRASALALAASLVPTTYAGHRFWAIDDPQERAQQRVQFLKNLAMFGGLLLAAKGDGHRGSARC